MPTGRRGTSTRRARASRPAGCAARFRARCRDTRSLGPVARRPDRPAGAGPAPPTASRMLLFRSTRARRSLGRGRVAAEHPIEDDPRIDLHRQRRRRRAPRDRVHVGAAEADVAAPRWPSSPRSPARATGTACPGRSSARSSGRSSCPAGCPRLRCAWGTPFSHIAGARRVAVLAVVRPARCRLLRSPADRGTARAAAESVRARSRRRPAAASTSS